MQTQARAKCKEMEFQFLVSAFVLVFILWYPTHVFNILLVLVLAICTACELLIYSTTDEFIEEKLTAEQEFIQQIK